MPHLVRRGRRFPDPSVAPASLPRKSPAGHTTPCAPLESQPFQIFISLIPRDLLACPTRSPATPVLSYPRRGLSLSHRCPDLLNPGASRTMSSLRKIEANRRNALKSTGPKTPEGKARSRLNALKHGLLGAALLQDVSGNNAFALLIRYESSIRRSWFRALQMLDRTQAQRRDRQPPAPAPLETEFDQTKPNSPQGEQQPTPNQPVTETPQPRQDPWLPLSPLSLSRLRGSIPLPETDSAAGHRRAGPGDSDIMGSCTNSHGRPRTSRDSEKRR